MINVLRTNRLNETELLHIVHWHTDTQSNHLHESHSSMLNENELHGVRATKAVFVFTEPVTSNSLRAQAKNTTPNSGMHLVFNYVSTVVF